MYQEHNLSVFKELGFFVLKSLLTLNGGAIIVLLTFLTGVSKSELQGIVVSLDLMEAAIIAFLLGIAFCLLTAAANYLLAYSFTAEDKQIEIGLETILFWQLAPPFVSFGFFVTGILVALHSFGYAP